MPAPDQIRLGQAIQNLDQERRHADDIPDPAYDNEYAKQQLGFDPSKPLDPSNKLPWQRYFDPSVDENLTHPAINRGMEDGYFEKQLNYGTGGDSGLGGGGLKGDESSPMSAAISQKYQDQYGNASASLKAQNKNQGDIRQSNELSRASNMLGSEDQLKMQNFKEQYAYQQKRYEAVKAWEQAKQQSQMQWLNMIIGGVSSIGGAVLGKV
jgi:hypothetical protein